MGPPARSSWRIGRAHAGRQAWHPKVGGYSRFLRTVCLLGLIALWPVQPLAGAEQHGDGSVRVHGELRQWHRVTVDLAGPYASERQLELNPFADYRMEVQFTHESGATHRVPGYFATDGDAANSSAAAGSVWRAHLAPERAGRWTYRIAFYQGQGAAVDGDGQPVPLYHDVVGGFEVEPTNKRGRDFRAQGRLEYVGRHHLRFAGTGKYFLKAGPDSPETLLAYADFDATTASKKEAPLKTWSAHVRDWQEGDPTWQGGKGKGLVGALNYLAAQGMNSISFLPYNAGGDGDNVWPFVARNEKRRYDCSKLDQWAIVFEHAQRLGIFLHFKLQENEIDDHRVGAARRLQEVPESLDGGALGPERKLYLRELVARFGHLLALNWNLGEENTQTADELRAMAAYLRDLQGPSAPIVLHTFPDEQARVYPPLLGNELTGLSLQNHWVETHAWTVRWLAASAHAGRPWVVAADEQGHWGYGVPPDPGYSDFSGEAYDGRRSYTLHEIRKLVLWGNLMAGGAGVEYYFGYHLPQHDLNAEDWRSREQSWRYARLALEFFDRERIPFWEMSNADARVGNAIHGDGNFCLRKPGGPYLVYLPWGGEVHLNLTDEPGPFLVHWFNPREGGELASGSVTEVSGGAYVALGSPPSDPDEDWLIVMWPASNR